MKRIGLMTGGGDCAGINAFLAACIKHGATHGYEFVGISRAFTGACADRIEDYLVPLGPEDVPSIENRPSTILQSSRFNPFTALERQKYTAILRANLAKAGIDAVLATGGNDTIASVKCLSEMGFPAIAVPKSIDNDVSGTDVMIGYKTAVIHGAFFFRSTVESARAHRRISVVEVMGRDAGWLVLEIGLAGGADLIMIPERPVSLARVCDRIAEHYERCGSVNIAVAEGVGIAPDDPVLRAATAQSPVAEALCEEDCGRDAHGNPKLGGIAQLLRRVIRHQLCLRSIEEVRASDLGYCLRGLPPAADDIILAKRFGVTAIELLRNGEYGFMLGLCGQKIARVPFAEALVQKNVDWSEEELRSAGVIW